MADEAAREHETGWYPYHGGQRFWDGNGWTEHLAPPSRASGLSFQQVVVAVWIGVVLAWGTVYLGAQASPDNVYWPVKFVVKQTPTLNQPSIP